MIHNNSMKWAKPLALLTVLVFCSGSVMAVGSGPNLLANSNFTAGQPIGWDRDAWRFDEDFFSWVHTSRGPVVGVEIPSYTVNDARWIQKVSVIPNTDYVLSGQIRTEGVALSGDLADGGANLSILEDLPGTGSFTHTDPLFDDNRWTRVDLEFNTGNHTEITIALRVGMYAGATNGSAWFRFVRLRRQ